MAVKRFSEFRKGNDRIKVYAKGFNSNRSVQLTGDVTGSAQSDMDEGSTLSIATNIADNAVTNSKISDGAVSTSKLQDDAVTSAKIDTGAVTVNKLGAAAVETDKIANGAVTLQKISTSAIDDDPTDASDNLVTSGGVKTALDAKADKVDDATEGNFAGLDANGNLTDSGISQDSVESAISSAGSAIQGVKVNNTTLTPDANKVVTVPLATTSADGAMSAADKTKLDAVDDIATLNSGASCYGVLLTDITISTGYGTADYVATLYIDPNFGTPSATREIIDIKFIFRSNSGGSYQVWSAVSEHRMSNSSSTRPFRIAYKTNANAASIYLLWKDDGSTTSENYRVRLKTLSKLGCTTVSYPLTRLSEQLTGFTLFTRRYMASTTESSGTAPVKVNENGDLTPVPMDSTPTASSTNLMTSGNIKTALDAKANVNKVVAIADASVLRRGQVGQGWYKLAETTTPRANYNINSVFDVVVSSSNLGELRGSFVMSVRYEGTGVVNVFTKSLFSDAWSSDYPIKIVTTKVSSTVLKVELFFSVSPSNTTTAIYSGISISERNAGNYGGTNEKNSWTYTSYADTAGSAEPVSDIEHDIEAVDVIIEKRQLAIASPTENNLVAMDANGLVKDSGKSVLLGTQTWDGTSDAKLPTPKAVQGAIDAKVKGNADVSSMGTDDTHAYSGKAVSTAISNAITGTTGGFLGNKTVAQINAYASPKMGDNAIVTDTGTITIGNIPCTISSAPAEIRWTTDGSWVVTSSNYVNKNDVATAQALGLVKTNPTDGGVELNSNNQMVVHGWDDKASASDVTSLAGRVIDAEDDISALQNSVGGKLNTIDAVWTIDDSDDAIIVDDDFMTWMFQA